MGTSGITSSRGGHALLSASVIRSSRGGLSALTPLNESSVRESSAMEPVSQRSNYSSTTPRWDRRHSFGAVFRFIRM
ncbi:hypothetical protein PC129_g22805 [Phytophthora cactorum]|uniref:Uncharacterized protein n=1 Tax=Phytophthora cactorum TaxID=29920 RepID=A0A8T1AMM2_9STRA|nr:hypothetical protein Pcac1_g7202 [Phytophthora cactorum]KAG2793935.1 hypothetical protein PC112_g23243 [Phytophthora cactorum]KAG2795737.1 hypothetical protein PC111_g22024 [Phytophthora cactorum]KAG2826659.1 hypothetical protein PC113_g21730 [Phytophthora cactorum]KAG2873321.1 hypothetical protein PC114_g25920 [Phytophthora cactorum]